MDTNNHKANNMEETIHCEDFLNDIDFWSIDIAEKLAKDNEIAEYGLTEDHWKVIMYVREHYMKYEQGPAIVKVVKDCGISFKSLCDLFPCGLVRGAYKVAGLPRPHGCI
jgi:tRNA 2-thiouridine synthesizing protein E